MNTLIIIVLAIGIFLAFREIMCWYWKINKTLENQEEIIKLFIFIDTTISNNREPDPNMMDTDNDTLAKTKPINIIYDRNKIIGKYILIVVLIVVLGMILDSLIR